MRDTGPADLSAQTSPAVNILIDELPWYTITKKARGVFLQGLSKNIRVIQTNQGWSEVPKKIRSACEINVFMKQRDDSIKELMDKGYIPYDWSKNGMKRIVGIYQYFA